MDTAPEPDGTPETPLVLHSSVVRLAITAVTPLALGFIGGVALGGSAGWLAYLLLGGAVVTGLVWLFDQPIRSEFDDEGVTRVCLLRRHRILWAEMVAVERAPGGAIRRAASRGAAPPSMPRGRGLVARLGARRVVLLVDRRESHAEHAELRSLLRGRATSVRAESPPVDATPAGRGRQALHRRSD